MKEQILHDIKKKMSFADFIKKKVKKVSINDIEYELASFDRRLISGSIDAVIFSAFTHPLAVILENITGLAAKKKQVIDSAPVPPVNITDIVDVFSYAVQNNQIDTSIIYSFMAYQLGMVIFIAVAISWFWYKFGKTPSKFLFRCRVIDADTGGKISLKQTALRVLAMIPSLGLLGFGLIGIGLSKRSRAFHDWVANTIVIVEPKKKDK